MFFIVFRLFQDEVEEMAYVVSEKKIAYVVKF